MCQSSLQEHVLNAGKDARIIYRITNMAALPLLVTLSQLLYIGQGSFLLTLKISICSGYNSCLPMAQSST